jgi:hypothetical protein
MITLHLPSFFQEPTPIKGKHFTKSILRRPPHDISSLSTSALMRPA